MCVKRIIIEFYSIFQINTRGDPCALDGSLQVLTSTDVILEQYYRLFWSTDTKFRWTRFHEPGTTRGTMREIRVTHATSFWRLSIEWKSLSTFIDATRMQI